MIELKSRYEWIKAFQRFADGEMTREEALGWFTEGIVTTTAAEGLISLHNTVCEIMLEPRDADKFIREVARINSNVEMVSNLAKVRLESVLDEDLTNDEKGVD